MIANEVRDWLDQHFAHLGRWAWCWRPRNRWESREGAYVIRATADFVTQSDVVVVKGGYYLFVGGVLLQRVEPVTTPAKPSAPKRERRKERA